MPSGLLVESPPLSHPMTESLERDILKRIDEQAVVSLDTLVVLMPQYSWSQIFHAVDRLARCGRIVLRRHRSEYTIFSTHYAA